MGLKLAARLAPLVVAGLVTGPAATLEAAGIEITALAAAEGSQGLRVHLGPECHASQTLFLDSDDGPLQGDYEACRVSAEGVEVAGAGATLRAAELIVLGDGFRVPAQASLELVIDASLPGAPTHVRDQSPIAETVYTARFSSRLDDLALPPGEHIDTLVAYSAAEETIFRLAVETAPGGGFQLSLAARQDGGGMVLTPPGQEIAVPAGWHLVELTWSAAPGAGRLELAVDGGVPAGLVDLDNGAAAVETIRWGAVDGAVLTASGSIDLDSFTSTR